MVAVLDPERLPFAWNFWVGFLGKMEQFIYSSKNRSRYDAVPFVKNAPVELSRLGRLVPRFTKLWTVGERMAQVRFLQMVQLIPVILVEMKKEEYLRRYCFYSGKFSLGWTIPFDISSGKKRLFWTVVNILCLLRVGIEELEEVFQFNSESNVRL